MIDELPQGCIACDVIQGQLVVQLYDETGARMTFIMAERDGLKAIKRLTECLAVIQQIREVSS